MTEKMIDLRSDTVTKPSPAMRRAIAEAAVGDDIMGEDPTVIELERVAAQLLGKEAGLLVTSGTQGNLLSVLTHCQRGDEYIAGLQSHIYHWEAKGSSVLGGVASETISFESDGTLDLMKVKAAIKPDDSHFAQTKLLALENTHYGKVLPFDYLGKFSAFAKEHRLSTHLDGARLFNAVVASAHSAKEISSHFDSVTFCLSKGLAAPIGSLICADKEFIKRARRLRKLVGGSMRQAGIIAAAGLYALKHNIERLAQDHLHAELLAKGLKSIELLENKVEVETNMVFVEMGSLGVTTLPSFLQSKGITIWGKETLRLVIHHDVDKKDIEKVIDAFKEFFLVHKSLPASAKKNTIY